MSLQDMAWLTQGPMAAVDLELDVESMEQEATMEDGLEDWRPAMELLAPQPKTCETPGSEGDNRGQTPEHRGLTVHHGESHGSPGYNDQTLGAIGLSTCTHYKQTHGAREGIGHHGLTHGNKGLIPHHGQLYEATGLTAHGQSKSCSSLKHGGSLDVLQVKPMTLSQEDSLSQDSLSIKKKQKEFPCFPKGDFLSSSSLKMDDDDDDELYLTPEGYSHEASRDDQPMGPIRLPKTQAIKAGGSKSKKGKSGRPINTQHKAVESQLGEHKVPPWRSQSSEEILKHGELTQVEASTKGIPKFGAIKVHAGILGTPEEAKSFVVTNQTTSRDLVAIVLASYHVICENQNLFCLVLEKSNKRFGFSANQRTIKLQDTSKPLELQTRYSRADTRFCLQLKSGAGVITLHDSCINKKDDTPKLASRSVFVTEKTTCRDLIDLVLLAHNIQEKQESYSLFEVDSNSKGSHELCLDHRPLVIQQQWLDPHEYYFEIRHGAELQDRKMRRHSIDTVDGLRRPQTHRKVLNAKGQRKSLIPRIKRGSSSGNISKNNDPPSSSQEPSSPTSTSNKQPTRHTDQNGVAGVAPPSSDRETTMAKLKDSLSKLREHLDSLQKRKTMSFDAESDPEALHMPHGDGPRNSDSSDENYRIVRNLKAEVLSKHAQNCGYETGDTSLNESDAGSTSASLRGNNDSAYASDRMSHTSMTSQNMSYTKVTSQGSTTSGGSGSSFQQRRRARRGSYTSSDQSSPENQEGPRGSTQLRKTQSLYELQRGQLEVAGQGKPARIRSASHAQANKGRPVRKNGAISGSDEQLNTWARRKQYDVRRRVGDRAVDDPTAEAETVKRSQSFQDIKPQMTPKGRPVSAGYDRSLSQMSGSSSMRGGVKMRRTLPKVPVGTEADIEERKKRMSAEIIRRARAGVDMDQLTLMRTNHANGYESNNSADFRGSHISLDDNSRVPVIRCSPETTSSREDFEKRHSVPTSQPYNGQVHAPQPKYSSNMQDTLSYHSRSSDGSSQKMVNGHQSDASDYDDPRDLYNELQAKVKAKQALQGESSQEALQRIINDLRNAATKPYEGSTSSRAGSRSSVSSITREYTGPETAEEQAEVVYSQLAQWGVLEPSEDDMSSQKYYNHQYSSNHQTSNDDEEEEQEEEVEEEVEEHFEEEQTDLDENYCPSSRAYSKSTRTNESVSSVSEHSDLRVEHPTIHRVLRSCDLVRASLERCDIFADFGFEIFESTFYDNEVKERSKRAVFRTPSGRRPVLGRRKGAFVPVAPVNQSNQEAGPILSLVAIDNVVDETPADKCGTMQEGDYIIEVNGLYVVDADVDRVQAEIAEAGNCLDLVLARPHEMGVDKLPGEDGEVPAEVRKDLERLKLKYDAMKQDAERSQDTIADLKIELKERDRQLGQLDSDLRMRDEQLSDTEKTIRQKEEEVSEWKYEANHRNVELARLKYENKQKEDRIAQLRRLLIQQTELMQMHQVRNSNGTDLEDFEEHVSAV